MYSKLYCAIIIFKCWKLLDICTKVIQRTKYCVTAAHSYVSLNKKKLNMCNMSTHSGITSSIHLLIFFCTRKVQTFEGPKMDKTKKHIRFRYKRKLRFVLYCTLLVTVTALKQTSSALWSFSLAAIQCNHLRYFIQI